MRSMSVWLLCLLGLSPLHAGPPSKPITFDSVKLTPAAADESPFVKLPTEIKVDVGEFVAIKPQTNGAEVQYHSIDPGLSLFPPGMLADLRNTVVIPKVAGRFRLLAYTAAKDKASPPAIVTIVAGNAPPVPPPGPQPGPGPDPGPAPNPGPRPAGFAGECYDKLKDFPKDELAIVGAAIRKVLSNTAFHVDAYPRIKKIMEANDLPQSRWSPFVAWYKDRSIAMYEADGTMATIQEQVTNLTSWQYAAEALSK